MKDSKQLYCIKDLNTNMFIGFSYIDNGESFNYVPVNCELDLEDTILFKDSYSDLNSGKLKKKYKTALSEKELEYVKENYNLDYKEIYKLSF